MLLTLTERLTLMDMLPEKDHTYLMKIMESLRMDLAMSEGELAETGLRLEPIPDQPGRATYQWDNPGIDKEIHIGAKARSAIVDLLDALNENKAIERRHLTLWDKFDMDDEED